MIHRVSVERDYCILCPCFLCDVPGLGDVLRSPHTLHAAQDEYRQPVSHSLEELLGSAPLSGARRHFHEGHDDSTIGVMTTITELDLAVQQAEGLQETISRAYGGNAVVQWFDEADQPETDE